MPENPFDLVMVFVLTAFLVVVLLLWIMRTKAAKDFMKGLREGRQSPSRPPMTPASSRRPEETADSVLASPVASVQSGSAAPRAKASDPSGVRTRQPKIFVSYRRADSADAAGRIYDRLTHRFGTGAVFKDVDSIPLGADFRMHIDEAVSVATVVLVVVGRAWLSESGHQRRIDSPLDFVRLEVAAALRRKIPVIPLMVAGATMPAPEALPAEIRDFAYRNAVAVRPDPDFGNDMDRLMRGIAKLHGPPA